MDNRTFAICILSIILLGAVIAFMTYGSLRARLALQDARVVKYQEKTKRAEERHELLDVFRRQPIEASRP